MREGSRAKGGTKMSKKIAVVQSYDDRIIQCIGVVEDFVMALGIALDTMTENLNDYENEKSRLEVYSLERLEADTGTCLTYKIVNSSNEIITKSTIYFLDIE
jgi:hypothetical protein